MSIYSKPVYGEIEGAIIINGFDMSMDMCEFEPVLQAIIAETRGMSGYVTLNGANYYVLISCANPILYSVEMTPDGPSKCIIGTMMTPRYEIPDLSTRIVWQQCRGIYGTGRWDTMRTYLLTATNKDITCAEFAKNVSDVLNKYIGYVSTASEMNSQTQSPSDIMGALTRLFYMETPEHVTEHMKKILKLMDQLNTAM
jgi:hypothetical protein